MPVCYQQFYGHEAPDDRLAEDDRVILKAGDEEQDEDDPYADFKIPDDLMW